MPAFRPIICFDTSGLNRLLDDFDCSILQALLTRHYYCRITSTNFEEITANLKAQRRELLLNVTDPLAWSGECVLPPNNIVFTLIRSYINGNKDWRSLDTRFYNIEDAKFRRDNATDKMAEKQLREKNRLEDVFCSFFDDERSRYDAYYATGAEPRPKTFPQFIERVKRSDGMFWGMAGVIFKAAIDITPDTQVLKDCIDECPPFRAFVLGVMASLFERGFRDLKAGPSLRAGRFDLFSAVYLCYCDVFISAEGRGRQYNALKEIAAVGQLRARVWKYEELRREVFPFSGMTTRFQETQEVLTDGLCVPLLFNLSPEEVNRRLVLDLYY
jgi:hypothetical protein